MYASYSLILFRLLWKCDIKDKITVLLVYVLCIFEHIDDPNDIETNQINSC